MIPFPARTDLLQRPQPGHVEPPLAGASYYVSPQAGSAPSNPHLDGAHGADTEGALLRAQRQARQAGNALDAFGHACITVRASDGRMLWQTPLARDLLAAWYPDEVARRPLHAPQPVVEWLRRHLADAVGQVEPPRLSLANGPRRLTFRLHRQTGDDDEGGGEWLVVMREESDAAVIESLGRSLGLTPRESEVLYWVGKGKINRDIADIVGASPATVKKHLERVYAKLGVETRTAAAAMAHGQVG